MSDSPSNAVAMTQSEQVLARSGQPQITGNLKTHTIGFPSPGEQTKIANILSFIDRKIESVASQIIETQTFKRGLLQQMFV